MSLHPVFAGINAAHAPMLAQPDRYRGWAISFDFPPIPCRDFDWSATSPDYDTDCDEDGFFATSGEVVHGRTREAVCAAVDAAIGGEA